MTVLEKIEQARQQSRSRKIYSTSEAKAIIQRLRRSEEQIRNGQFCTKYKIKTILRNWVKN